VLTDVYAKLDVADPAKLFPMDGNDAYGDCTIAALAHATTVYQGLVGKTTIMPSQRVTKLYFHLTGGIDSGLAELDVLNFWRQHTVSHEKILAFASIDVKNHTHVKQAINLFGGVYLGFQCPVDCEAQFNARTPWTPGPLTNDGHAVFAVAYTQRATWAWWDECVDEAYAILPAESKVPGFAPGFDFAQLKADLADVAN